MSNESRHIIHVFPFQLIYIVCFVYSLLGTSVGNFESPKVTLRESIEYFVAFHHKPCNPEGNSWWECSIWLSMKLQTTIIEACKEWDTMVFKFSCATELPGEFVKEEFLGIHPQILTVGLELHPDSLCPAGSSVPSDASGPWTTFWTKRLKNLVLTTFQLIGFCQISI